jgi:hypothetical protein
VRLIPKRLFALAAALVATVLAAAPTAAAQNGYVVVSPSNMNGWGFWDDTREKPGTGQMVFGPAGQPLGVGSAELTLTSALTATGAFADGEALVTTNHDGTLVDSIIALDYWTYTRNKQAISIQLAFRTSPLPGNYHRLVYEPGTRGNPAVTENVWQWQHPTAPTAGWWVTNSTVCNQSTVPACTWTEINALFGKYPLTTAGVWLKAGSNWQPGKYNVDAFLFVASAPWAAVLYDFEPERNGEPD